MNNLPMKSPAGRTPQKAYKHVKFMPLAHVRRVVDIRDNDGEWCTTTMLLSAAGVIHLWLFVGFPNISTNQRARKCTFNFAACAHIVDLSVCVSMALTSFEKRFLLNDNGITIFSLILLMSNSSWFFLTNFLRFLVVLQIVKICLALSIAALRKWKRLFWCLD